MVGRVLMVERVLMGTARRELSSRHEVPSRQVAPSRQNPKEAPISMRRAGPADVGVPKNDDCWLPMNAL